MKHRLFSLLLAAVMLFSAIPAMATETEPTNVERAPGYCGDAIMWSFDNNTLTITGAGAMDDFPEGTPWEEHKDEIQKVVISGGITYIGAFSFCDYDKLTEVEFGKDVYEIGERAFFSCDGLTAIYLPAAFKVFGLSSFMGCSKLTEIHCEGKFPSFRQNCLWDTWCKIYFPADRPWGVEYIQQLEEAFHGRIEFLASDGTDPYVPTEPTEETEETVAPTEAPTTVPPTTELPTEAPTTIPPTEEVTEPAPTEETTVEVTAPILIAPRPTEPAEEEKGGNIAKYLIIGAVAVFVILGSLIFGGGRKKGKYSR